MTRLNFLNSAIELRFNKLAEASGSMRPRVDLYITLNKFIGLETLTLRYENTNYE